MLTNAYLLAKIGADTAENEQHFAEILPIGRRVAALGLRTLVAADLCRNGSRRGLPSVEAFLRGGKRGVGELGLEHTQLANFANFLQIFSGLVLGCIKTKFCKKICV